MAKIQKNSEKAIEKTPNLFDIPENILVGDKRVFYPNWNNRPPKANPIILLDNKRVLTQGNYMAVTSKAGAGKSSICEAIASNVLNPDCDSLGFKVSLSNSRNKCLYIDTERTLQDSWLSWERMMTRAKIYCPDNDSRVIFQNIKSVAVGERLKYTEKILKENIDIGLVIIDGGGDFVMDINSVQDTIKFSDWINSFNPLISIVMTLHTNPKDDKPRGHLGSEMCRRAESVMLLKKIEENTRLITTEYEYGKVRNDSDNINVYYQWSDNHTMFVSANYTPPKPIAIEKTVELKKLAEEMFIGRSQVTYGYMVEFIREKRKVGDERAKKIIAEMKDKQIKKVETNVWEQCT